MTEATGFLYPFIEAGETDAQGLLADLAASALDKARESSRLQIESLSRLAAEIATAGRAMAERVRRGGRIYTFGNGGSSSDAATLAALFARPASGRPVPAWSLATDQAVLTALGNDIGFDVIFSRQLIAHAKEPDVAIAFSTSGNSPDLLLGLAEAHRRRLLTIAFSGYAGGKVAASPDVDHCFTIASQSIHRIQESQARVGHALWVVVQEELAQSAGTRGRP